MSYLDVGYPQEADVEHAVGHEAHQIQGHEVEAQTNDTVEGRRMKKGRGETWEGTESLACGEGGLSLVVRRALSYGPFPFHSQCYPSPALLSADSLASPVLTPTGRPGGLLQRQLCPP